jgi:VWFA-related protein
MLDALLFAAAMQQQPQLQEQITVERVIVDARVTDAAGNPITGLRPSDFHVSIDGKRAAVESAEWIADTAAQRDVDATLRAGQALSPVPPPSRGRLLIFLIQTDYERTRTRIRGQMKLLQLGPDWLDWIEPEDRVAVLSFDSHLKFRLDFTSDKRDIANAMKEALYIDDPPWPRRAAAPSLGARLEPEELARAGSPERALTEIGNALASIPGPKSLILFGWGLGRFSHDGGRLSSRVRMASNYWMARQALEMARASVFSIDFTEADSHSLAVGLAKVAGDTGGFYASTHNAPHFAAQRLQRTLSGHYELEVRKPATPFRGTHVIEVEVARRDAYVMARSTYIDR